MSNASIFSFEFFPVKTEEKQKQLLNTVLECSKKNPIFMSVTYGAGGSTQAYTLDALKKMTESLSTPMAGHLTCVGDTKENIDQVAEAFWQEGVHHIVALRGDVPVAKGESPSPYKPYPGGYKNAEDLIHGLKKKRPFEFSVAAYPEKHPDSPTWKEDIENLKRKFDAGATRALTQFFFEPDVFLRFRDRAQKAGIDQPIVPGILPILNLQQVQRFAQLCGAHIPAYILEAFDGIKGNTKEIEEIALKISLDLCRNLQSEGVNHFHIFTLNNFKFVDSLTNNLNK